MTSLLHLPLLLVPGLAFAAIALLLHAPISRARLLLSALAVCVVVALVQSGLMFGLIASGAIDLAQARVLELVTSTAIYWLALWRTGKLPPGRAALGALAAVAIECLVQFGWSTGLGGRVGPPR